MRMMIKFVQNLMYICSKFGVSNLVYVLVGRVLWTLSLFDFQVCVMIVFFGIVIVAGIRSWKTICHAGDKES